MNRIFGVGGWSCEVLVAPHIVHQFIREVDVFEGSGTNRHKTGTKVNHVAVVVSTVRVTICGAHKDGEGASTAESTIDAFANSLETAFKGAVTDGMKRACILLGERFGITLYDKAKKQKGRPRREAGPQGHVRGRRQDAAGRRRRPRASTYLDRLEKCGDKAALQAIASDVEKDPAHDTIKPLLRPSVDGVKRKLRDRPEGDGAPVLLVDGVQSSASRRTCRSPTRRR